MSDYVIRLPDVGEGVAEAEIVEWHVNVGDTISEDDVLAEVMTDKATVELPSPVHGVVRWLGAEVGDIVAVGADIIRIETDTSSEPAAGRIASPPPEPTDSSTGGVADTSPIRHGTEPGRGRDRRTCGTDAGGAAGDRSRRRARHRTGRSRRARRPRQPPRQATGTRRA